jgi:hypothetical protein
MEKQMLQYTSFDMEQTIREYSTPMKNYMNRMSLIEKMLHLVSIMARWIAAKFLDIQFGLMRSLSQAYLRKANQLLLVDLTIWSYIIC